MSACLPVKQFYHWLWMKTLWATTHFACFNFQRCAVYRHQSIERLCKNWRPHRRRPARRKGDHELHGCSGECLLLQVEKKSLEKKKSKSWPGLFQTPCRGDAVHGHFRVTLHPHYIYFKSHYCTRPLLSLANDECATANQVEFACAAISNMAAVEENQRPLCKAGAIGILSRIEDECQDTLAACVVSYTMHIHFLYVSHIFYLDHAQHALQNISRALSRNILLTLISHSNPNRVNLYPSHSDGQVQPQLI